MTMQAGRPDAAASTAAEDDAINSTAAVTKSFLAAFRRHPAGVAIVTGDSGDGPVALTVSSLISVSVEPPMVAFSLSKASSSARALALCETVVVHFVRRQNMKLARLCATRGAARFGPGARWARLATGEPHFPQNEVWFRAAIRERLALPGACLVTAELLSASPFQHEATPDEALVYADRAWHGLRPLADPAETPLLMWPIDSATF
jgi:flavin reductase (DIM6/NTAB) family NADH-FMN oxidoreductase RutF